MKITEQQLLVECRKLIRKHEHYMRELRKDDVRRKRRLVEPHVGVIRTPSYWGVASGFNPYKVRRNAASIVRAVNLALAKGDYRPKPPMLHKIQKADGGERIVSIFQIVDSIVSQRMFRALMEKNKALLSARSYAYRDDLSTHDAVQYISSELNSPERIFVAEYDFSKYFDTISHEHIRKVLLSHGFLMTDSEKRVIEAFLDVAGQLEGQYDATNAQSREGIGLPQGTSISLFLANVAATPIDRSLERIGVGFARYADDTLIWSRSYAQVCDAANVLKLHGAEIGANLNYKKSNGIRLMSKPDENGEIESTEFVKFVGYKITGSSIGFADNVIVRIKSRINDIIWQNLIQPLQRGTFDPSRIAFPVDRDYLVALGQIRRYLYGDFSENRLRTLQHGSAKAIRFPGVLAYFPLVNDGCQLKELDGWLLNSMYVALKKRWRLLSVVGGAKMVNPHGLRKDDLISAMGKTRDGGILDLRVPSVARFMSVLSRSVRAYGANRVGRGTGIELYQYSIQ